MMISMKWTCISYRFFSFILCICVNFHTFFKCNISSLYSLEHIVSNNYSINLCKEAKSSKLDKHVPNWVCIKYSWLGAFYIILASKQWAKFYHLEKETRHIIIIMYPSMLGYFNEGKWGKAEASRFFITCSIFKHTKLQRACKFFKI